VHRVQDAERGLARVRRQRRAVLRDRADRAPLGCTVARRGLVAARMARAIPRLRRGPRRWARRPLPVPPPAHVRALRVDGPGTIHGAGLVSAVVMVRGALGARALERTAFAARWSRPRALRTLGARARGAVTLEARPLAGFDRWPLAAHETLTGRT